MDEFCIGIVGHLGRLDKAVSHWQKAADLNQSLSIAFRNLGLYYWNQKELDKAQNYYRQAIREGRKLYDHDHHKERGH